MARGVNSFQDEVASAKASKLNNCFRLAPEIVDVPAQERLRDQRTQTVLEASSRVRHRSRRIQERRFRVIAEWTRDWVCIDFFYHPLEPLPQTGSRSNCL